MEDTNKCPHCDQKFLWTTELTNHLEECPLKSRSPSKNIVNDIDMQEEEINEITAEFDPTLSEFRLTNESN